MVYYSMLVSALSQGLLYAPMALGVFITFRILRTPDLTVDGSFVFGMTACAVVTISGHPVLALFAGKTPLIIELKVERGNAAALTDAVMAELSGWSGTYCIESFHPGVLLRLKEKYPWVIRGQLSENFLRGGEVHGLSLPARFALTNLLTTGLTRPDFVAYRWQDRGNLSLRLMRGLYGVHEVGWTVRDQDTLDGLAEEEVPSIFEGFLPENS